MLTFVEATAVGGERERRVLFANGVEADFAVFPASAGQALVADPAAASTIARGHRVLHDELALAELLDGATATPAPRRDPRELAEDFWYHALWAAEKLRRGEELTARFCVERVLKGLLLDQQLAAELVADPPSAEPQLARLLP